MILRKELHEFVSRGLLRNLYFAVIICLAVVDVITVSYRYKNGGYTSDGFHYFYFMRNVVEYHVLWEGPTFQNLLATHSYFTLVLLSPIAAIFPTPLALGFLSVISQYVAAFLIFRLARLLQIPSVLSLLISSAYLFVPVSLIMRRGEIYLFQPDYMIPALVFGLVLSGFLDKPRLTLSLIAIVVFTKEEWIIQLPLLLVMVVVLCPKLKSRFFSVPCLLTFGLASTFSILSLLYARRQTGYCYCVEPNSFSESVAQVIRDPITTLGSILFFAYLLFLIVKFGIRPSFMPRVLLGVTIFVGLIYFRLLTSYIAYGSARPFSGHWANASFLLSLTFVFLVVVSAHSPKELNVGHWLVGFCVLAVLSTRGQLGVAELSAHQIYGDYFRDSNSIVTAQHQDFTATTSRIRQVIDKQVQTPWKSYYVVDTNVGYKFVELAHVDSRFAAEHNESEMLHNASFVIVDGANDSAGLFLLQFGFNEEFLSDGLRVYFRSSSL